MASHWKGPREALALASESGYSVRRLAHLLGISRRHLHRLWILLYGIPPGKWLKEVRLRESQRLLKRGLQIKAVANALKFRNRSGFTESFLSATGKTPSSVARVSRPSSN